jgi:hypothetical protein
VNNLYTLKLDHSQILMMLGALAIVQTTANTVYVQEGSQELLESLQGLSNLRSEILLQTGFENGETNDN